MGINERDYIRKEAPSFMGSAEDQTKATTWLIALSVGCFVLQLLTRPRGLEQIYSDGAFTDALILDSPKVMRGEVWRLFTAAFLHDTRGFFHIFFNLLGLWWFGRQVEEKLGTREFLAVYLLAAAFSSAVFVASNLAGFHGPRALGASGAIAAVLMLSALYWPNQVVYLYVLPVSTWFLVVFMLAKDGFEFLNRDPHNHTASAAHLGGLFFGFAYDQLGLRLTSWLGGWTRRARPRLKLYAPEREEAVRPPSRINDEHLEAQMDAILEKMGRVGRDGLTEKELEVLKKASEAINRRRQ